MQAVRGKSFVLEGPPGTGKSQTIANLITHAMLQGKSILFVAAKEVALDVVRRRLDEIGIGRFALALYGADVSMNDIRIQLKRSLDAAVYVDKGAYKATDAKYRAAFRALRDYPPRVHRKNGWQYSYWSAYDLLQNLGEGPSWMPDPGAVGLSDLNRLESLLTEFVGRATGLGLTPADPWILCGKEPATSVGEGMETPKAAARAEQLQNALSELAASYEAASCLNPVWMDVLNALSPGERLHLVLHLRHASEAKRLPGEEHLLYINRVSWQDAVSDVRARITALHEQHGAYLHCVSPALLTQPELDVWNARVRALNQKQFFVNWRKKSIREAVLPYISQETLLHEAKSSNIQWEQVLQESTVVRDTTAEIIHLASRIAGLLLPSDWRPDLPEALAQFDHATFISRGAVWLHGYAPAVWAHINTGSGSATEMKLLQDVSRSWDDWLALLGANTRTIDQWLNGRKWLEAWEHDMQIWIRDVSQTGNLQLQRYTELRLPLFEIEKLGAGDLADKLARVAFPLVDADTVFLRGVAEASFQERGAAGSLVEFDANAQAQIAETYNVTAARLRDMAVSVGPDAIINSRPFQANRVVGEVASLVRQIERKRGGMSFREITKSYPKALLSLCPCFMMSPGSVAHFLDADVLHFDIVVFDEASQIRVPQAIGAMGRGNSVVIVGDSKQMPPTRIMEVDTAEESLGEPESGAEIVDLESILSEAVESGLPQMWLSWHYRSKNEQLIAFSNKTYYEEKLVTLPEPGLPENTGILLHRVEGSFARGKERTNTIEAEAIIREITRRLYDPTTAQDSMGVVCFNMQQRDLILDLLENSNDPQIQTALSDEPGKQLFVKNLENVQGDERDVILFSLAFSKDPETGILPLNFGPLNNDGGERRLNVAITRARKQVLLFCSFDPKDINLARSNAKGIHDLKRYLEFAAHLSAEAQAGSQAAEVETELSVAGGRSYFARELADALRARGYLVHANLGLSSFKIDLAVKKPEDTRWRTAIVIDSPAWGARIAVADRDGVSALLKQLKGWQSVARVWLPGWIRDREGEMKRLVDLIETADEIESETETEQLILSDLAEGLADESGVQEASIGASAADAQQGMTDEVRGLPIFLPASVDPAHPKKVLNNPGSSYPIVCGISKDILQTEGPTALARLISIIYKRCGYTRIGTAKQRELAGIIRRDFLIDQDDFVWSKDMVSQNWSAVRYTSRREDRAVNEISKEELLCAMELVLRESLSIERGELIAETARRLGYERLGAENKAWIESALVRGLTENRFQENNGRLVKA
jgi:hypothetical protein